MSNQIMYPRYVEVGNGLKQRGFRIRLANALERASWAIRPAMKRGDRQRWAQHTGELKKARLDDLNRRDMEDTP